jgi:hypothetical protein
MDNPFYGLTFTKCRTRIDERYDAFRDQYGRVIVFDKTLRIEWYNGESFPFRR